MRLYKPGLLPSGRVPQLGEVLFEFVRASDWAQIRCDLRYLRDFWGVEAQFLLNGDVLIARRFETRALAVQWAKLECEYLKKGSA